MVGVRQKPYGAAPHVHGRRSRMERQRAVAELRDRAGSGGGSAEVGQRFVCHGKPARAHVVALQPGKPVRHQLEVQRRQRCAVEFGKAAVQTVCGVV